MEFAEKVTRLLASLRLTQDDLAAAMGTTQQQISRWVTENKPPTNSTYLLRMARALETTVDYLIDPMVENPGRGLTEDDRAILDLFHILRDKHDLTRLEVMGRMILPPHVRGEDLPLDVKPGSPPKKTPGGPGRNATG